MKIAILGTRGIPNNYGGFEECAEYLAQGLVNKGHEVIVYNSHNHHYQQSEYKGAKIIHIHDPEYKFGNFGQIIYDFNCAMDVRNRNCDIILQMGSSSSSISSWLLPKNATIVTTLDGLEWKRKKHNFLVKTFIKISEKIAVKFSDFIIVDNKVVKKYILNNYHKQSTYIPYGTKLFNNASETVLEKYNVEKFKFNMFLGRLDPENNIETILDGVVDSNYDDMFLVIGNHLTKYGNYLKEKYKNFPYIVFLDGIFDNRVLNSLRYFSNIYFHGHTSGVSNSLLLRAMRSSALVCASDNDFNKSVLEDDAMYFNTSADVAEYIRSVRKTDDKNQSILKNNLIKIEKMYNWDRVVELYENCFNNLAKKELAITA
jgi:glycosyltransferase involved in cell wall biosynthesis